MIAEVKGLSAMTCMGRPTILAYSKARTFQLKKSPTHQIKNVRANTSVDSSTRQLANPST